MGELIRISPFRCRMWSLHDRLTEDVCSAAIRQLTDSIRQHGQKHPVLGRRLYASGADGEHEVELIYGARRLAATRDLGIDLLVDLRVIDDCSALVEMDIENRIREDISPYERGLSYRRWLRTGMFATQSDLSKALGVSEAQLSRLLRFAEMPAIVVAAFESHRDIREEWAGVLARLCKNGDHCEGVVRRARRMMALNPRPRPDEVFDYLISDGTRVLPRMRVKDEVIKSRAGRPLFRIGVRARAVHFILPRVAVTSQLLRLIADEVRVRLENIHHGAGDSNETEEAQS